MKKILALVLCLVCVCGFAACGAKEEAPKEIDVTALATELYEAGIYDDILSEIPTMAASRFYNYAEGDVVACALYQSTAAAAEEVFVAQCASEEAVATVKAGVEQRIQDQIASYENYVPTEVPKLNDALVITEGLYVIFVVSNDAAAAQSIIDSYL